METVYSSLRYFPNPEVPLCCSIVLPHQLIVSYSPGRSALSLSLFCFYLSDCQVLFSLCLSVAFSFLLSPVSFQCQGSTCYPMRWLVQRAKANGLSGFRAAELHGAASSQIESKCVGHGSSHHSFAQTPSTSDSKEQMKKINSLNNNNNKQ